MQQFDPRHMLGLASVRVATCLAIGVVAVPGHQARAQDMRPYLTAEAALEIATTAWRQCRDAGQSASVTVVGREGEILAQIRGEGTAPHTVENGFRKAYTARAFGVPSAEIDARLKANPHWAAMRLPHVTNSGGGLPIRKGSEVIGGAGASGAQSAEQDAQCIQAGLDKVAAKPAP